MSWTGSIPVGGTVTITGTVTVNNPDHARQQGHRQHAATAAPGSNCPPAAPTRACTATADVLVPAADDRQGRQRQPPPCRARWSAITDTITDTGQTAYTGPW